MSSSGGELRDEDYFTILKKVKSLSGQIDDDSRGSFRLPGGERGQKKEKGNFHSFHLRLIKCAKAATRTEFASADEYLFYPSHGRIREIVERPDCPGQGVGNGQRETAPDRAFQSNCTSIRVHFLLYRLK